MCFFLDVRVDVALSLAPGLAAKLLFLCVRQADCSRDEARAQSLCTTTVTAIKAALNVKATNTLCQKLIWLRTPQDI